MKNRLLKKLRSINKLKNRLLKKLNLDTEDNAWDVVLAGFFLVILLYGSYYCFGVFLKPILSELGWSRALTSGAISVYMFIHGASGILMGYLSDKYGARWVTSVNTIIIALGYYFMSKITEPVHLYLSFGIIIGFGMGAAYVPPLTTVTRWFVLKRGLAIGIVAAGVGVGQIIFPPFTRYLITIYGWRNSLVIIGLFIAVAGFPVTMLFREPSVKISETPDNSIQNENNEITGKDYRLKEAAGTSSFMFLLCIFITLIFGLTIVTTHLVAHLDDMGFGAIQAAFVLTLIGGSGIIGRIAMGGAADRYNSKNLLPVSLMLQALLLFSLIWVNNLQGFYIVAALYGLGYGGTLPLIIKKNIDFFGTACSGTIFGVLIFGGTSAGAIGAPYAGYIYDKTGDYSAAFLTGGIVLLAGVILSLVLNPPRKTGIKVNIKEIL